MSSGDFTPGRVIEPLAIFPLSNCVLFPGALLPLHVFEPRYRTMIERVLASTRQLCVAFVPDPHRIDEHGSPPIAHISGVGEIVRHQCLPDGRYNLVVLGKARVALDELPFEPPYRRARAEILKPEPCRVPDPEIAALVSITTRFTTRIRSAGRVDFTLPPTYEPGALADACANALIIESSERQRVLETLDVGQRVRLVSELVAVQEALLARGAAMH